MVDVYKKNNNFDSRVCAVVKKIPKGKVATYGQIAALISSPRAARAVGFALRRIPDDIPWQRVINSKGLISIENMEHPAEEQAEFLKKDGVSVKLKDGNYWVDLEQYLWKP